MGSGATKEAKVDDKNNASPQTTDTPNDDEDEEEVNKEEVNEEDDAACRDIAKDLVQQVLLAAVEQYEQEEKEKNEEGEKLVEVDTEEKAEREDENEAEFTQARRTFSRTSGKQSILKNSEETKSVKSTTPSSQAVESSIGKKIDQDAPKNQPNKTSNKKTTTANKAPSATKATNANPKRKALQNYNKGNGKSVPGPLINAVATKSATRQNISSLVVKPGSSKKTPPATETDKADVVNETLDKEAPSSKSLLKSVNNRKTFSRPKKASVTFSPSTQLHSKHSIQTIKNDVFEEEFLEEEDLIDNAPQPPSITEYSKDYRTRVSTVVCINDTDSLDDKCDMKTVSSTSTSMVRQLEPWDLHWPKKEALMPHHKRLAVIYDHNNLRQGTRQPELCILRSLHKCTSDVERLYAILRWMLNNIELSVGHMNNDNRQAQDIAPEEILKQQRADARGFAVLFLHLCGLAKVKCLLERGFNKVQHILFDTENSKPFTYWNLVSIGDDWYFIHPVRACFNILYTGGLFRSEPHWNEQWFLAKPYFFTNEYLPIEGDNIPAYRQLLNAPYDTLLQWLRAPLILNSTAAYVIGVRELSHEGSVIAMKGDMLLEFETQVPITGYARMNCVSDSEVQNRTQRLRMCEARPRACCLLYSIDPLHYCVTLRAPRPAGRYVLQVYACPTDVATPLQPEPVLCYVIDKPLETAPRRPLPVEDALAGPTQLFRTTGFEMLNYETPFVTCANDKAAITVLLPGDGRIPIRYLFGKTATGGIEDMVYAERVGFSITFHIYPPTKGEYLFQMLCRPTRNATMFLPVLALVIRMDESRTFAVPKFGSGHVMRTVWGATDAFYSYGFSFPTLAGSTISTKEGEGTIRLAVGPGVELRYVLHDSEGAVPLENYCITASKTLTKSEITLHCEIPNEGMYRLALYANTLGDQSVDHICDLLLVNDEPVTDPTYTIANNAPGSLVTGLLWGPTYEFYQRGLEFVGLEKTVVTSKESIATVELHWKRLCNLQFQLRNSDGELMDPEHCLLAERHFNTDLQKVMVHLVPPSPGCYKLVIKTVNSEQTTELAYLLIHFEKDTEILQLPYCLPIHNDLDNRDRCLGPTQLYLEQEMQSAELMAKPPLYYSLANGLLEFSIFSGTIPVLDYQALIYERLPEVVSNDEAPGELPQKTFHDHLVDSYQRMLTIERLSTTPMKANVKLNMKQQGIFKVVISTRTYGTNEPYADVLTLCINVVNVSELPDYPAKNTLWGPTPALHRFSLSFDDLECSTLTVAEGQASFTLRCTDSAVHFYFDLIDADGNKLDKRVQTCGKHIFIRKTRVHERIVTLNLNDAEPGFYRLSLGVVKSGIRTAIRAADIMVDSYSHVWQPDDNDIDSELVNIEESGATLAFNSYSELEKKTIPSSKQFSVNSLESKAKSNYSSVHTAKSNSLHKNGSISESMHATNSKTGSAHIADLTSESSSKNASQNFQEDEQKNSASLGDAAASNESISPLEQKAHNRMNIKRPSVIQLSSDSAKLKNMSKPAGAAILEEEDEEELLETVEIAEADDDAGDKLDTETNNQDNKSGVAEAERTPTDSNSVKSNER